MTARLRPTSFPSVFFRIRHPSPSQPARKIGIVAGGPRYILSERPPGSVQRCRLQCCKRGFPLLPSKAPTLLVRLPLSLYLLFSSLPLPLFLSLFFLSRFRLSSRNLALKARTAVLTLFSPLVHVPPSLTFSVSLSLFLISAACHSTNPRVEFKGPGACTCLPSLLPALRFHPSAMSVFAEFSRKPSVRTSRAMPAKLFWNTGRPLPPEIGDDS